MSKLMKIAIGILVVIGSLQSMYAQAVKGTGSLEGIIIDTSTKKAVEFATIALVNGSTNQTIDGTVTDEKGSFSINNIPAGTFNIVIDFLGYQSKTVGPHIFQAGTKLKLGKLYLSAESVTLKEVTVEGQTDVVEEKVDRLVYNADRDISSRGGDASDVMKKVPLLTVDLDGNVSLRGSSNVRVLINNKPSSIMAGSVADALKQIPADMIKSVEVITSPSARYDSEGSAGIINIITKKNTLQGMTLGVDLSGGNRGAMLGLNGSYRKGNMGFSLRGHGRAEYNIKGAFENTQTTATGLGMQTLTQSANTLSQRIHGNYNFGWDWDITKKSALTAGIRFGTRSGLTEQDNLISSRLLPGFTTPEINGRNVDINDLNLSYDINATYTYTVRPETELNFLGLYSRNHRNNDYEANLLNNVDFATISSRERNDNTAINEESTLQLDYQTALNKSSILEFGGKGIFRTANSDYQYYVSEGTNTYILDPYRTSNVLDYNQTVGAGFVAYTLTTKNRFSFKAGTRLEYTDINAKLEDNSDGAINSIPSYWTWVPSINLSKPVSKKTTLKLAYNKRIQRPGIQFLNPNINAANPTNISVGNPTLDPELTDNYEFSSSINLKGVFLTAAVFYRHTGNSITSLRDTFSVPNPNPSIAGVVPAIRTTYENIGNENTLGFNVFGNVTLFKSWQINGGFDFYNVDLKNNNPNSAYNASNNGWVFGGRAFTNVKLKNGWGIQGGGGARGRQVNLQGYSGSFRFYSIGLRKDFKNGKGNFNVSTENFLNFPFRVVSQTNAQLLSQTNTNSFYNAGVRIGVSYRFGKMNFTDTKRRKSINNDDLKGEGGGGMGQENGSGGEQPQQQRGNRSAPATRPAGAPMPGATGAPAGQTMPSNTPGSSAQPGARFGGNPQDAKIMHDSLGLNPEQIVSFDRILEKYSTKMRTMMEESRTSGISREELQPKMLAVRAEQETELKTILSEEQLAKYKKLMAERMARMQGARQ